MVFFFSIFFGTFILEDVALATAITLIAEGKLSFLSAFVAASAGIAIGDVALYFVGRAMGRFELEKKWSFLKKYRATMSDIRHSRALSYTIVISRAIPGTRVPTYLSAGFLKYPLWKFIVLTVISVAVWVEIALLSGRSLQALFMDHWVLNIVLFLIGLRLLQGLLVRLGDRWSRKAFLHSWRRWTHFEFWPSWLFYLPIAPYYLYLSVKSGSLLTPLYANPNLANGGLIGESKWDFLKHLDSKEPSTLSAIRLEKGADFEETHVAVEQLGFSYPFIIKPDIGQRGFAVRVLKNDFDLTEYLLLSDFDRIIQRRSLFQREAGIFYIREPHQTDGIIFSITDKLFPFVTGDGATMVGDLVLADKRARIIAPVYFERLREQLDRVLPSGEKLALSECGNHCQGAIFKNGEFLNTAELAKKIDAIAKRIPDFYFGRFDIRYRDTESLKKGEFFEIVEVNGAGAEATHIWDSQTKLIDAYRTLFVQWKILFDIGHAVRSRHGKTVKRPVFSLLRECARVMWRKDRLSVSS